MEAAAWVPGMSARAVEFPGCPASSWQRGTIAAATAPAPLRGAPLDPVRLSTERPGRRVNWGWVYRAQRAYRLIDSKSYLVWGLTSDWAVEDGARRSRRAAAAAASSSSSSSTPPATSVAPTADDSRDDASEGTRVRPNPSGPVRIRRY